MIWEIIRYGIFALFLCLTCFFVYRQKHEYLLWLYFFTFPFQNCAFYLITTWNPYKVVAIGMLFCILFHPANSRTSDVLKRIVAYFFIMLLLSNLFSLLMPPENVGTRTLIRLLVQDATYILGVVPLLFMNRLPRDFDQRVIKWYTYAICTLIGIGFVHYFFLKAGIPFAPIIRDVGTSNAVAATFFGGDTVFRIYGLCGEPKNMAFALTPFVLFLITNFLYKKKLDLKAVTILALGLFILLNTFSSAAFIEFAIGLIGVVILILSRTNKLVAILTISTVLVIGSFGLFLSEIQKTQPTNAKTEISFINSFYERSFGRAQNEIEDGRSEVLITKDFIESNNPIYYLFGYGPGQYSFHSKNLTFSGGYIPVQSGLVLNLVDFGLIGYLFFFYLLYQVYTLYKKSKSNDISFYFIVIGCCTMIGNFMYSMMGGSILIGMLPFIGIAFQSYHYNTEYED